MTRVTYERDADGVVSLVLTRPGKRNAIDLRMAGELHEALVRFGLDDDARVAVLSGEGQGFSAGGDITMFPSLDANSGLEFVRGIGESIHQALARSRKPIIAATHGFCYAGGFEIALACHMIYASKETLFAMKEVRLGLIPGWGGTVRLARSTSPGMANDLLLTGRSIEAPEAKAAGVVARVFESPDECLAGALAAAKSIAAAPPLATESVLSVVRAAQTSGDDAFSLEQSSVAMLFGHEETQAKIKNTLDGGIGKQP